MRAFGLSRNLPRRSPLSSRVFSRASPACPIHPVCVNLKNACPHLAVPDRSRQPRHMLRSHLIHNPSASSHRRSVPMRNCGKNGNRIDKPSSSLIQAPAARPRIAAKTATTTSLSLSLRSLSQPSAASALNSSFSSVSFVAFVLNLVSRQERQPNLRFRQKRQCPSLPPCFSARSVFSVVKPRLPVLRYHRYAQEMRSENPSSVKR